MAKFNALLFVVLASFAGEALSYRFLKGYRLLKDRDPVLDTPYMKCDPPPKAKIDSFQFGECTALPCPCSSGKMYNLTLGFTPDVAIIDLTSKVTVTVGGATIPFVPPVVPDACKDQGLKCPLAPNVLATFKTGLTFGEFPLKNIIMIFTWKLVDTKDTEQVCVKFSCKVD